MSWNERLASWTGRSSDNEDAKRQRTERQIRDAIRAHSRLSSQPLKIYAKGSYANNTNVRLDSDVDICVEYSGGYHYDGVGERDDQISKVAAGISDYTGPYTNFDLFKSDVENALRATFGGAVSRSNKCIRIRGGDTTLPADVVPCWEHRAYYQAGNRAAYYQGTILA
ncbi:MAG: nucleotidyltransferase domain-containing protein [Actinomycetota bacterium]